MMLTVIGAAAAGVLVVVAWLIGECALTERQKRRIARFRYGPF